MSQVAKDIVSGIAASNPREAPGDRTDGWSTIARACRKAADARETLPPLLEAAIDALEAERAFVIEIVPPGGDALPRVVASVSKRRDGAATPSRSVLRWASTDPRPRVGIDLPATARYGAGDSIRALSIRHVLAAGIPGGGPGRRALVLDGRRPSPLSPPELVSRLESFACLLAAVGPATPAVARPGDEPLLPPPDGGIVGDAPALLLALRAARRVAPWRLPVLVVGETGSGKEAIARLVHAESPRRDGPFVPVNCAAVPESLLESELFGSARGAYTGADQDRPGLFRLAHGGTLFLDEVGDMPAAMQGKLLRVLQDGRVRAVGGRADSAVDVRVIAATHRDLGRLAERGLFRDDLRYRIAVVEIRVPPLRERVDDLPLLAAHLLARLEEATGLRPLRIRESALRRLAAHRWPGNVRELEAVLARALVLADDGVIEAAHLDLPADGDRASAPAMAPALESAMVECALRESRGNLARAARRIGWSRQRLYRRIKALESAASEGEE